MRPAIVAIQAEAVATYIVLTMANIAVSLLMNAWYHFKVKPFKGNAITIESLNEKITSTKRGV